MNTIEQELTKSTIEYVAWRLDCSFIEACQKMQSTASKKNNETMIEAIHKIKMQYLESNEK